MIDTERMADEIVKALGVETVFTIPIFGGIKISESIVVMWLIMVAIAIVSLVITRNLSIENPSKRQLALELGIIKLDRFFRRLVGEKGTAYVPYLLCVFFFLTFANMFPLFGFKPPTKDLNVTLALAIMSIVVVEIAGIRAKGARGWAKSFTEPVAIVTPMNILEIVIKPFSLCMRLMGNMLGGFAIMELNKMIIPVGWPAIASIYFDIFDALLQAFVFVFLTGLYIQEATEFGEA